MGIGGMEWLIILLAILLLFGASRIPKVMRGMGEGIRAFKDGLEGKGETKGELDNPIARILMSHIGAVARFENGVIKVGGEAGSRIAEVTQDRVVLEGDGETQVIELSRVQKVEVVTK